MMGKEGKIIETKEDFIIYFENILRIERNESIIEAYRSTKESIKYENLRIKKLENELIEVNSDIKREEEITDQFSGDPFEEALKKTIPDEKEQERIREQIEVTRPVLDLIMENMKGDSKFRMEIWIKRKTKLESQLTDLRRLLKENLLIFEAISENYKIDELINQTEK